MEKMYVYYGEKKDFKKLMNLSYSIDGLSYLSYSIDNFCGFKLSIKLERRLKLFKFDKKNPRKIVYLCKIINKSKICTKAEYDKLSIEAYSNKNKYYADSTYKKMPKAITKDNQDDYKKGGGYQSGKGKLFCTNCRFTHSSFSYPMFQNKDVKRFRYSQVTKCSNCGAENTIVGLHSSVRVPRKKSNEKTWKRFYKLFIEEKIQT